MARIINFPAIPGVKDFTTLLAFLADKDAYDARLKSLKDMEESIKAEVVLAGKVEEIDTFHAQAVQARDEAKKILDAAHIEALKVKGEADEYLATTKSTIDSQVEVLATGQAALEKKVEEAEAMYQAREAKLKTWQADLEAREEAVTKAHSKAEDLRNTLQAKLSQLKSIAE